LLLIKIILLSLTKIKIMDLTKLKEPLDPKAISKHPTKPYLSSIKAIYVTERFNDVFGIGKWTQKVRSESCDTSTGMVVVHVTFEVPELGIYYESFGGNDNGGVNSKNFDLGDAYKGATTDALTKIGSYLGVGIDVFKGIESKPSRQVASKPSFQIASKEWHGALRKNASIIDIRKYFHVTDEVAKSYLIALQNGSK
jgi:hypothetical protein